MGKKRKVQEVVGGKQDFQRRLQARRQAEEQHEGGAVNNNNNHHNYINDSINDYHNNNNNNNNNIMWSSSGSGSGSSSRRSKGSSSSRMNTGSSSGGYSPRSGNASGVNEAAVTKMFAAISDEDDPTIASMEGICTLCEDLEIDALEDIRVLVLLWRLGANAKPAQISKDEWCKGCTVLEVDSVPKLKALLPSLDPGFLLDSEFKDFYKFTFQFNREGTHRTLDKDLVIALLKMVLKDRVDSQRLSSFNDFLENGVKKGDDTYSRITLDQWMSIFDFCKECRDLNVYDEETSAWPVLIDEYVDYMKKK